jgi:hypothetical protein
MTSFVLLNDMKAEASWALLGLTCRLAQSLGVHLEQTPDVRDVPDVERKEMVRRKLWWTCFWHDTLTSLSFDRSPMTNIPCCPIPVSPKPGSTNLTYLEAMYHLCEIICRRLNPDEVARATYARILDNCQDVENIRQRLIPQLRDKELCRSAVDRLQYFAIRLHTSFVVSVCCRPALRRGDGASPASSPGTNPLTTQQKKTLADKCKDNLTETVRMFLSMHQLSVIPTRSWAFTYHGLSSAVLLGIMGETKADPEVRQLQGDLILALSATAAKEQTSPAPHIPKTDRDIELSGPLSRALMALKNIYDHGSINAPSGYKGGIGIDASALSGRAGLGISGGTRYPSSVHGSSGTRTPLQISQLVGLVPPAAVGSGSGAGGPDALLAGFRAAGLGGGPSAVQSGILSGGLGQGEASLDPHQNAALAMAEMQNGSGLVDFSGLPFNPRLQQAGIAPGSGPGPDPGSSSSHEMAGMNIDPSTYMSPMDLYDQIFWGESSANTPTPALGYADTILQKFRILSSPVSTR